MGGITNGLLSRDQMEICLKKKKKKKMMMMDQDVQVEGRNCLRFFVPLYLQPYRYALPSLTGTAYTDKNQTIGAVCIHVIEIDYAH